MILSESPRELSKITKSALLLGLLAIPRVFYSKGHESRRILREFFSALRAHRRGLALSYRRGPYDKRAPPTIKSGPAGGLVGRSRKRSEGVS